MQKTAYEMRISDWSSDVFSSDLVMDHVVWPRRGDARPARLFAAALMILVFYQEGLHSRPFYKQLDYNGSELQRLMQIVKQEARNNRILILSPGIRSEERRVG